MPKQTTRRKPPTQTYSSPPRSSVRERRETRILFEKVAKSLIKDNENEQKLDLELFCKDLIGKQYTDIRQNFALMESNMSSRIGQIESLLQSRLGQIDEKLATMNSRINGIEDESRSKTEQIIGFVDKNFKRISVASETESSKRVMLAKKLQAKEEKNMTLLKQMVLDGKEEVAKSLSFMKDDIHSQSTEVGRLRENVDEM